MTMLASLSDGTIPKFVVLEPQAKKTGWFKPSSWFNDQITVYFLDPITFQKPPKNAGIVIKQQKKEVALWLNKAKPYLQISLTVLKGCAIASKLAGVPVDGFVGSIVDFVDRQLEAVGSLADAAMDAAEEMASTAQAAAAGLTADPHKAEALLDEAQGHLGEQVTAYAERTLASFKDKAAPAECERMSDELQMHVQQSAKCLKQVLDRAHGDGWIKETGLIKVRDQEAEDGGALFEWVLETTMNRTKMANGKPRFTTRGVKE